MGCDREQLRALYETPMPESLKEMFTRGKRAWDEYYAHGSWDDRHNLVYKPAEFNMIKRPAERYLTFDPEYVRGMRFKQGQTILNDSWTINLRSSNKPTLVGMKMFSEKEAKFILDSAETDLKTLKQRKESLVREIADTGVRLSKMQEAETQLASIVEKLQKALKKSECDEDDDE